MRMLPPLRSVPLLLLTLACGKSETAHYSEPSITPPLAGAPMPPANLSQGYSAERSPGGTSTSVEDSKSGGAPKAGKTADQLTTNALADSAPTVTASMIIRTGQASIEVTSVDTASARIRTIVQQLGGYVANATFQGGKNQVRSATLELKIPATRFDEVVAGLSPVGTVESVNVTAEDVGEEFVDVTARLFNARKLEQRLLELLAQRTGKLSDVLEVEQSLANVREEIERYEGRLRYLRTRAATSTLTVTVHERQPIFDQDVGQNPIAEAFKSAWRNFVGFVASFIAILGYLIPLALLIFAGWWLYKKTRPPRT